MAEASSAASWICVINVRRDSGLLARQLYHILLFTIRHRLVPELFDGNENPHTIADFLDSHLLEDFLITFNEVVAVEIIC